MTSARAERDDRIEALDGLRGIAVLAVMLYHYTARFSASYYGYPAPPIISVSHGHLGVQLFFMISGFVIFMTLPHCRSLADFIWKRFARLYPAYWIAIAITFSLTRYFSLPDRSVRPVDALINLTMVQTALHVPDVDGAYWSLFHELFFYALASSLYFLLKRSVGTALLVLSPMPFLALIASRSMSLGFFYYFSIFSLPFFVYGISMYAVFIERRLRPATTLAIAGNIVIVFLVYPLSQALLLLAGGLMVLAVALGWKAFLCTPMLIFFGRISYSLYLIHQNIGLIVIRQMTGHEINMYLSIAAACALTTAIAVCMHRWVEEPSRRLLRNWWRRTQFLPGTASNSLAPARSE